MKVECLQVAEGNAEANLSQRSKNGRGHGDGHCAEEELWSLRPMTVLPVLPRASVSNGNFTRLQISFPVPTSLSDFRPFTTIVFLSWKEKNLFEIVSQAGNKVQRSCWQSCKCKAIRHSHDSHSTSFLSYKTHIIDELISRMCVKFPFSALGRI